MNVTNKYSDNELHLMSYQELRRLSILLQLPANIKKKYMISMIQAHQKGDGCTKTAIANKIMEERKVKKLSTKGKQTKAFMLSPSSPNQQIPTDLSVATKHEFETRFSYVAHYTSKDNITSGISRIIKQEAEVSRRNRSIMHQTRKPTRKLSTAGRTEIMLPRNHSLTTPVRLMPQSERGYVSPNQFEKGPGMPNGKNHYQDANYNCHFHGEYSNAVMQSTTHDIYKNEPYWPTREVYNNSLMPILSSLLTTNPDTINSSVYASQYTSQNILKAPSSFQGVYEKYIKNGSMVENEAFQAVESNTSTVTVNSHYYNDSNSNYNNNHGCRSYIVTKNDVDFEINSAMNEIDYQHYPRRDEAVIRNTSETQNCVVDFYLPRNSNTSGSHVEDLSQCNAECFKSQEKAVIVASPHRAYNASPVTPHENPEAEPDIAPPMTNITDYESVYIEDKFWEDSNNRDKRLEKERSERENYGEGFLNVQTQSSMFSEISENSTDFSLETESSDPLAKNSKRYPCTPLSFSRCRYVLGHNRFPEAVSGSVSDPVMLPSFLSTFCTSGLHNKAYSVCRNSFTGTTEAHLNPIMTCSYVSQFAPHTNPQPSHSSSSAANSLIQRQWLYSYPEPQAPFSVESTTYSSWDEYSDMGNKIVAHNNGHEVQVVKCRKHGCHYLYSISNPCD